LCGCNVHWARSYQRVAERVNHCAKEKLAVDAFCKITKCITEATQEQDVYKVFDVLQGNATLDSIQRINTHLTENQKKILTLKWKGQNTRSSGGSCQTIYKCFVNHFPRFPQVIGTIAHAILIEWRMPIH